MIRSAKPSRKSQSGFMLLEVLIALLILSFGLIGIGLMQVSSLKSIHQSYLASVANLAARDVKEHLWEELLADSDIDSCPAGLSAESFDFNARWGSKLPEGSLEIVEPAGEACRYTLRIRWRDERYGTVEIEGERFTVFDYYVRLPGAGST